MGAGNAAVSLPATLARSHISSLSSSSRQIRISAYTLRRGKTRGWPAKHLTDVKSCVGFELRQKLWRSVWQSDRRYRSCPVPQAQWKQDIAWSTGSISETTQVSEELYSVVLNLQGNEDLLAGYTKPGQYVQLRIKDSKPAFLAIASSPKSAQSGQLEFLIKAVEGTTAALLCDLKVGDEADVSPVMGKGFNMDALHLAEDWPTIIIFATGSGISPIRSLIEHGFEASSRKDVRLYYGADNLQKMAYQERFEAWEASGVKVIPVLSQAGDSWTGEKGYVQDAFKRAGVLVNGNQTGAVLVGQKEMAEDVTTILLEAGVAKDKMLTNF